MVCLNTSCLFRVNRFGPPDNCDCSACPNRYTGYFQIQSDRTLSQDEIKEFKERFIKYGDFRIGGIT